MILIDRTETNPYFNIAAEEYVLKTFDDDVFMLWINSPSVIIGKHQLATAEADRSGHFHLRFVLRFFAMRNGENFNGLGMNIKPHGQY